MCASLLNDFKASQGSKQDIQRMVDFTQKEAKDVAFCLGELCNVELDLSAGGSAVVVSVVLVVANLFFFM